MTSIQRILNEKRGIIVPLAIALLANLAVYGLGVYPLSLRVDAVRSRADQTVGGLQAAKARYEQAHAMEQGKARADEELQEFYEEVLPTDLAGARRITYLHLAQLARQFNLSYERRTVKTEREEDSTLSRLRMVMVLSGQYADIRRFIYELERAREFIVIENVALAQSEEQGAPLVLTLGVATYYRESHGA